MLWYYARNGQRFGPIEETELLRLATTGQLAATDLVWKPGLAEWRPAGEVPEIASALRPAAPPPPPPPPAPAEFSPYAPPSAPLTSPPAYGAPMFGTFATPEYASFGTRFAALLIDQLIVGCFGGTLLVVLMIPLMAKNEDLTGREWIINAVSIVIGWLYYAGFESSSQMATLGKRLVGLKVTDLEGRQISFGRATKRHFGKILSALALFIGFFSMISDERKQTWHDKMADCLVIRAR